ncbi:hypothetical protein TanjilG_03947 [Lupinus angustifolius]|uniref:Uncharacterized protein n=1 Tax=Lupinus angustifolius TaxID=3871 RepID=A0A4P1R5A5_LUPAN|nr:hypothetical protein TanjilG_03947 [Lupinus angustifolius]
MPEETLKQQFNHICSVCEVKQCSRVLYLQGKERDAEALIQDSIKMLEMYLKSHRLADAEMVQRKILHIMELSKVAMKLAPDRKKFMDVVGGTGDINADIEKFCSAFSPLLEENHKFLGRGIRSVDRLTRVQWAVHVLLDGWAAWGQRQKSRLGVEQLAVGVQGTVQFLLISPLMSCLDPM